MYYTNKCDQKFIFKRLMDSWVDFRWATLGAWCMILDMPWVVKEYQNKLNI